MEEGSIGRGPEWKQGDLLGFHSGSGHRSRGLGLGFQQGRSVDLRAAVRDEHTGPLVVFGG